MSKTDSYKDKSRMLKVFTFLKVKERGGGKSGQTVREKSAGVDRGY